MPRPEALTCVIVPSIQPIGLVGETARELGRLLVFGSLPDEASEKLAWIIACYGPACAAATGHTAERVAAELCRIAKHLRGGECSEEILRRLIDPRFGLDYESHNRLAPLAIGPVVDIAALRRAVEARRGEVIEFRHVKPKRAVQALTAAYTLLVWRAYGAERGHRARQWDFVLAVLEACEQTIEGGKTTEGLRRNPRRLLRDLGRLPELTRAA